MRFFQVKFYMLNNRGTKLGSEPVIFKFYAPGVIDHTSRAFSRMLLEYGRSIGRSGSQVEIISVDC